jgi:hypothetical protein
LAPLINSRRRRICGRKASASAVEVRDQVSEAIGGPRHVDDRHRSALFGLATEQGFGQQTFGDCGWPSVSLIWAPIFSASFSQRRHRAVLRQPARA